MKEFKYSGTVEIFPGPGGWHYVIVPKEIANITKEIAVRGLTPIRVTIGRTSFNTSLLPYGDGRQFLALSKNVRKQESINLGDIINISFTLREY